MIQPAVLASERPFGPWGCLGSDVWEALQAAAAGDAHGLRHLLARDGNLYRAEYWYTQPIHLAVRGGHAEAVRVLLDAGADPSAVGLSGDNLMTMARDRGHEGVARLLGEARSRLGTGSPDATAADHPIHAAAAAGDAARVGALLEAEPALLHRRNRAGATPLHLAVAASAREVVALLLDRGADVHAINGPGSENGYAAAGFQAIDLALWRDPFWGVRGDLQTARLLLDRGAVYDLAIASALGDLEAVTRMLDEDPERIGETRPCGKRPLSAAVEFEHRRIARRLLERGADPNGPEGATAPRGAALHAAARAGDREMVEVLLGHGADPNAAIDSAGSATYAARTPELRALLLAHGGQLDPYDLVWLGEDDEALRRISEDPGTAHAGCGGALAAAAKMGKRDLVARLLAAGVRVPPVLTTCRSYLWSDPDTLALLLESGMDPDLPDWQRATPLHDLCARDARGRPRPHRAECAALLLDAGARITARDEEYLSTPLAWAARNGLPDMVGLLLGRGAPADLPEDEPWARPLAWAQRRGHTRVADLLRAAGASG